MLKERNRQVFNELLLNLSFSYITLRLSFFTGSGNFGQVFEGTWSNNVSHFGNKKIAIKIFKKNVSITAVLKEVYAASKLNHDNIVQFHGICFQWNAVIFELMEGGQLLSYLKTSGHGLKEREMVGFCFDIANVLRKV